MRVLSSRPLFEEIQEGFRVTVYLATQKTIQKTIQKTKGKISTKDQIISLLKAHPNLTRAALALELSKSENTVKEHLARLKSEGRLRRIGSDRSGHWEVLEHDDGKIL